MSNLWQQLDCAAATRPQHIEKDDLCYYTREYISKGGYESSEANDLISNFKKSPSKKGKPEWKWKVWAAKRFAQELAEVLPDDPIMILPSSKPRDHAEYDPRFDMMLDELRRLSKIIVEEPIVRAEPTLPLHDGGSRNVQRVKATMRWVGFSGRPPTTIILIDDMLTWGTTFKACQSMILDHHPKMVTAGLFWTKCIWLD